MTDEPEDPGQDGGQELEFIVDQDSHSEVYEWSAPNGKGGIYIFPSGVEAWASENDVGLLHIDTTTGVVTVQRVLGDKFQPIEQSTNRSSVKSIK